MISIQKLFEDSLEIPDEGLHPFEIVQLARKKGLVKSIKQQNMPNLKEGEYAVPMTNKNNKKWGTNPLTGRKKKIKKVNYHITTIPPEERTLKNLPRYASQGNKKRGKPKVRFQDWLSLKKSPKLSDKLNHYSWGWSPNGRVYGWSHRAIGEFYVGKEVTPDTIGNKFEYSEEAQKEYRKLEKKYSYEVADKMLKEKYGNFKPYKIKTDKEAEEHAKRFAADVA